MRRIDRLRGAVAPARTEERYGLEQWSYDAALSGFEPFATTWGTTQKAEPIGNHFTSYVQQGYKKNGIIFSVIGARLRLFTEARFQFQEMVNGRPGDLFDDPSLSLLDRPWPNGTTGDLLAHMEQDASLAGNSYTARLMVDSRPQLRRLRPDWTDIILGSDAPGVDPEDLSAKVVGYVHWPKGKGNSRPVTLLAKDVAHYAPTPDPEARYRGMSWLTPVVEEIRADTAATEHKGKFFDNAATPNLAVSLDKAVPKKEFLEFVEAMREHEGSQNAYKTLWLAGGADVKVVGADLKQLDFKVTQGAGETRIAAAGGVPPIIVGLSEGLDAATYSNYGQARRSFGDSFARPAWRQAAGALEAIVPAPTGSRLWYDADGISFLQEDQMDAAEILSRQMLTIESGVRAGYTPASVAKAVKSGDLSVLEHTGLFSVQLQPPSSANSADVAPASPA